MLSKGGSRIGLEGTRSQSEEEGKRKSTNTNELWGWPDLQVGRIHTDMRSCSQTPKPEDRGSGSEHETELQESEIEVKVEVKVESVERTGIKASSHRGSLTAGSTPSICSEMY